MLQPARRSVASARRPPRATGRRPMTSAMTYGPVLMPACLGGPSTPDNALASIVNL